MLDRLAVREACFELVNFLGGDVAAWEQIVGVHVKQLHFLPEAKDRSCLELYARHIDNKDALQPEVWNLVRRLSEDFGSELAEEVSGVGDGVFVLESLHA